MTEDFIGTYFTKAILEEGVAGYNIINTPIYAVLFALAVLGAYRLLKKLNITIDKKFTLGIFPFILLGGVLRVVRDANVVQSPLLVSPIIYFTIFVLAVATLIISVLVSRMLAGKAEKTQSDSPAIIGAHFAAVAQRTSAISYHIIWCILGLISLAFAAFPLFHIGVNNQQAVLYIAGITAMWFISMLGVYRWHIFKWFTPANAGLLGVHMFDATTTYVALQFFASSGYYEQHVVSNVVIGFLGPAGQFVLKLVVVPIVLYILDKELCKPEQSQLRNFLKIAVLILGLALGLRNMLRLALGV
jgi:uncharacterized membrane protein